MAADVVTFIHELGYQDLPTAAQRAARRCVLDLIGVAVAGTLTPLSRIMRQHAVRHFGGAPDCSARLLFDGRLAGAPGAAMAGACTIDSFDAHDGHVLTKGHAGAAILPAILAYMETVKTGDAHDLLTDVVLGYEIATRAGIALHASASEYHTSGAWNALGCAAIGARRMALSRAATRHALAIAEYHGPRSPILHVIEEPTMLKDGSAWGALAGVSAAFLAADGFTGAPAVTIESPALAHLWTDLGARWRILEQYFKAYPVCRWAQPAVEAVLALKRGHHVQPSDIRAIEIHSFNLAVRLSLRVRQPTTTEEAQYSLPYSVAAAVVRDRLGLREIMPESFADPEIRRLVESMELIEAPDYEACFPAERWAHAVFHLVDGRRVVSDPAIARGNPENPLSDSEVSEKFQEAALPLIGADRAGRIRETVGQMGSAAVDVRTLLDDLTGPVRSNAWA